MNNTLRVVFSCFLLCFLACILFISPAFSDEPDDTSIPLNPYGIRSTNPYLVDRLMHNGRLLDVVIVPGSPNPSPGVDRPLAPSLPEADSRAGTNTISDVPALTWSFGCVPTATAMMFGHYDRSGYPNMYAGPTNGGVFPMTNETWGTAVINGVTLHLCPLSATRNGLDGRTTKGHVDDYYITLNNPGPDPFLVGGWTQHAYGECTGDYMGSNQSLLNNPDGSTTFYYNEDGSPLYDFKALEPEVRDGCHGMRLFAESRGYTVETNFSQYIYGYKGNTKGFTFTDFKNEIDAGRPVIIHLEGHSMLGYGYDDAGSTVYLHDTWDYDNHSMTWGGSYDGRKQSAVAVVRLAAISTIVYVSKSDSSCNGNSPCYDTIQKAIDAEKTKTGYTLKISQGDYYEVLSLEQPKELTLTGGWDQTYQNQEANKTVIYGSPEAKEPNSSLTFEMLTIKPAQ